MLRDENKVRMRASKIIRMIYIMEQIHTNKIYFPLLYITIKTTNMRLILNDFPKVCIFT